MFSVLSFMAVLSGWFFIASVSRQVTRVGARGPKSACFIRLSTIRHPGPRVCPRSKVSKPPHVIVFS